MLSGRFVIITLTIIILSTNTLAQPTYTVRNGVDYDRVTSIIKDIDFKGFDKNIDFTYSTKPNTKGTTFGDFYYYYNYYPDNVSTVTNYNIRIYKESYDLSDDNFRCVLKHELAHFEQMKLNEKGLVNFKLTEEYANVNGCGLLA